MDPRPTLALGLLIVLQNYPATAVNCPRGYSSTHNLCYKFESTKKSWNDANALCKKNGGQELVSWNNDDSIGRVLQRQTQGQSAYIGLKDRYGRNDHYVWMDGTLYPSHTNMWDPAEPSTNNEQCVQFDAGKGFRLNDVSCHVPFASLCKACSRIDKCTDPMCRSGPDSRSQSCRKCEHTYIPTPDTSQCEKACEYNNPCWPGTCAGNYLRNCICANGFRNVNRDGNNHCQLSSSMRPQIETCRIKVVVHGGKMSDSPSNSSSTHCDFMQDFYGNYQPEYLSFDVDTSFTVNTADFPAPPDVYQTSTANFGVTDVKVQLVKKSIAGHVITDSETTPLTDSSHGKNVKNTFSSKANLTISSSLINGDRLCAQIEVKAGGFMRTKNVENNRYSDYEYDKTTTSRTICYIMDTEQPKHKSELNSSTKSPFEVSERISRTGIVNVSFVDWIDPIPKGVGGNIASGIEKYEVSVYDMKYDNGRQSVGPIVRSSALSGSDHLVLELNLTFSTPKLVCLVLEVKDVADNIGLARQFVLYDSSSVIEVDSSKSLTVTSASPATHLQWQTHHNDICLSWKDYFVNKVYLNNNFLKPIDSYANITDIYDQSTGILPISGTPNIHGIIAFNFSWSRNGTDYHLEGPVPNFLNQTHCQNIPLKDGETYTLNITAIDIVNNNYRESRTVSIDRTVPHINNIWLVNGGQESLFVHGDENGDLTEINISFDVLDPHSGIQEIQWAFGVIDGGKDIASKNISVNESNCTGCNRHNKIAHCICPSVGRCQVTKYVVSLKGNLLKNGNHNRNYYFTIKATNHARLSNLEHVEILVDTSPPEKDVVFEGPHGSNDVDYTSSSDFMVHWHGFVDHESGIMGYQIALAEQCLTIHEMKDIARLSQSNTTIIDFHETPSTEDSMRMHSNFTGKYYVTVVALNNANQLSDAACSDGITIDDTRPTLNNLSLTNGRWRETLHCMDNSAWLLHASLVKIRLDTVPACVEYCKNATSSFDVPRLIPEKVENTTDEMIAEFLCLNYDKYSANEMIYLSNDHLELTWDVDEELSQVEEVFVGLGTDQSEALTPSLLEYKPTNKRSFYRQSHLGFSTNDPFYVFLKVTNKAGLDTIASLGPIIIDETPPVKITSIDVTTNHTHIVVGWENGTFVDPEQHGPIRSVFFQIESDGKAVTALLEWNVQTSRICVGYSGGCITYPLRHLQAKDTRDGRFYTVVLHVFNNAGHELQVSTRTFKIPSIYPPGHGTVMDIDPSYIKSNVDDAVLPGDISAHTTAHTLCCTWTGFNHHENVSFEIGVGTTPDTDTVYPFQHVPANGSACLHSLRFVTNMRYFLTIRSSCSGGATLSSSDGVTIVNATEITNSLVVTNGRDCRTLPNIHTGISKPPYSNDGTNTHNLLNFTPVNMSDSPNNSFSLNVPLRVGFTYFLQKYENDVRQTIDFETTDAITEMIDQFWYKIIPFSERPSFSLVIYMNASDFGISVHECRNGSFLDGNSILYGHWSLDINVGLPVTYEVAIGANSDSSKAGTDNIKQLSLFRQPHSNNSASVKVNVTDPHTIFRMLVRPCIESTCFPYTASPGVKTNAQFVDIEISEAMLTITGCSYVDFELNIITPTADIMFFQWTISRDLKATHILDEWKTILIKGKTYHVNGCTESPMRELGTPYVCVRAYTWSSTSTLECTLLHTEIHNDDSTQLVYEFDVLQPSWKSIKQLLNSRYLGSRLTELLNAELDFGNTSARVISAMPLASERNVTWYLMTSNFVPDTCTASADCITSLETDSSNYVIFRQALIPRNRILYSCVLSNKTSIDRENHAETLDEIKACSDGFVVDTTTPIGGSMVIPNHNQYITDVRSTIVYWHGFSDNINITVLGYTDPINYYTISAGSQAGWEDLLPRTHVGHTHTHMLDGIDQPDGTGMFITITGTDQSGLQTSITSQLLILDTSPPTGGRVRIDGRYGTITMVISSGILNIELSDFNDPHSGIDYFEIGIGSQNLTSDLVPMRQYTTNYLTLDLDDLHPTDGKTYFVIVQAVNRAGLKTEPISTRFIMDRSSPSGGHVLDGTSNGHRDSDYQINDTYIAGHWYGFNDHHSGIQYYRVGLGSQPYTDDVDVFTDNGLTTNVVWWRSFTPGTKYYITVEACNGAGLCKQVSSDGLTLDRSAPIPGRVRVGYLGNHGKYQSKNTSVHIQWSGFSDTESGIDHFEVCLGTGIDACDIHPYVNSLLSSSITKTGLDIPTDTDVYATVKAFNKVGMSVTGASDAFRIDLSSPVLVEKPSIVMTNNYVTNCPIQYDPSVLRLRWKFEDTTSPIISHFVTLKTHHEGHSPIENLELGPTDTVTISLDQLNWLNNGDTYFVIVTSCNAAGLCTSAKTDEVMIDSTPPHQGGFTSDLNWRNFQNGTSELSLSWHSFVDAESGIDVFYITVSRSYSGSELSGGIVSRSFVNGTSHTQQGTFSLTETLNRDDKLYLTIWSQNLGGLNSSVSRISVNALATKKDGANDEGILEIEKHSCQPQYCSGDCTCAVVGKPCEKPTCPSIDNYNQTEDIPGVDILWGLPNMVQTISASTACLAAHWTISASSNDSLVDISRYEYSIGLQGEEFGTGVFRSGRVPWVDVGQRLEVVHCLTEDMELRHGEAYVFYVKAWLSRDVFYTYNSSSILIDQTPPSIKKGAHIKDADNACTNDLDIIDWMDTITGCWKNVFIEQQGTIVYYTVSLGTSENADDTMPMVNVGLQTSITLTNISMQHGTKYFFTVTAYNSVGLHTTVSSDGFLIDMDRPRQGVVFNTKQYKNANYQSDTGTFSISWTGFTDDQSGIRSYFVALSDTTDTDNITFYNAQLNTQYTFTGVHLQPGQMYHGLVKAIDPAGHESDIAISPGRVVDTSGPEGFQCLSFYRVETAGLAYHNTSTHVQFTSNFVVNGLYKVNGTLDKPESFSTVYLENGDKRARIPTVIGHDESVQFEYNFVSPYAGARSVTLLVESAHDILGNSTLWRCDVTKHTAARAIDVKQIGPTALLVTVLVRDEESSIYKVQVGVGSTPGGFQIRPLQPISGGNSGLVEVDVQHGTEIHVTAVTENHAGLKSTFTSTPLVIDHTGPDVGNVDASITLVNETDEMVNDTATTGDILVTADVTWSVSDKESGLQRCYCSFGYLPGSEDLMRYTLADSDTHCTSDMFRLSHGTNVYGNVRCVNNVEMKTETTTQKLTVIYAPPSAVDARVRFIVMDTRSVSATEMGHQLNGSLGDLAVQSTQDQLAFEWHGFTDTTGIDRYAYRVREGHHVIADWRETKKNTVMFANNDLLTAGTTYTVDVLAVNKANSRSVSREASIMVDNRKPQLSGLHPHVTQTGQLMNIDWRTVFRSHATFACQYSIVVGTRLGSADIADIRDTSDFKTEVTLPVTTRDGDPVQEVYINVECLYPNGLSQIGTFNHRLMKREAATNF